jgi:hypothetical protein
MFEDRIVPELNYAIAIVGGAGSPIRRSPLACRYFGLSALLSPDWSGSCGL